MKDNDQNHGLKKHLQTLNSSGFSRRQVLGMGLAAGAAGAAGLILPDSVLAKTATKPPSQPKGQVIVGMSQEPTVFNPLMPAIEVDQGVWWNLFSPLWGIDPDGKFFPQLAAEVPTLDNGGISKDGLDWKIKLRGDVKWHDGKPFTAEDVKYTIDLINNPHFKAGRRIGHELVKDIKVVSPTEITWHMEKAYAPYPSILAWTFIVPKHILAKADDPNTAAFNNAPIGTGAFKWKQRVPGDHIMLEANREFFGEGPYLERLVFKYIPDMTVLYTQFRTGEVDYTDIQGINPDHYAEAKKLPDRKITPVPQAFVESITVNFGKPQFTDKAVREALYYAMNKDAIIEQIYYGLPRPTESYLPRESWAYNPNLPKHEHNPAKARKILDQAGWKPGSGGVREKNGVRLEFSNSTTAGNHVREQAQQLLMQDWQAIGVSMKIKDMPPAVVWGEYWHMSKFESVMVGIDFMVGADPDASDRFTTQAIPAKGGAGENSSEYSNPEVDKLFKEGATTFDRAKRKAIYMQTQKIIRDDLALLPIFQYTMIQGTKDGLVGFRPNINVLSNSWNINTWYWAT